MADFFLVNPGFELGDTNWITPSVITIENDAVNARSGQWVLELIGPSISQHPQATPMLAFRPNGTITINGYVKGGSGGDNAFVRVRRYDKDLVDLGGGLAGNQISPGGGSYALSTVVDKIITKNVKFIQIGMWFATPSGTWYADDIDAFGDVIEAIPAAAIIRSYRCVPADTVGMFDPLVGSDKFSEFNAGMSDKWSGLYTFIPVDGGDLSEIVSFIRRVGRRNRIFAFDPKRRTPVGGIVNGMTVDGATTNGTNRIPVTGAPVSSTPLVAGEYIEVKDQYFLLQRDLNIGPEGTGDAIVWPAVRSTLEDGEHIITDNPVMVARVTSDPDWRGLEDNPTEISISWEEV